MMESMVAARMKKHKKAGRFAKTGSVKSARGRAKIEKTLHEFKEGELHSGSKTGPKVTNRKQAIAIAINQAKRKA